MTALGTATPARPAPRRPLAAGQHRAYVAYSHVYDGDLLARLTEYGRGLDSPFSVVASSADVEDGDGWEAEASRLIESADVVLVVVATLLAADSRVRDEAEIAFGHHKRVIAIYDDPADATQKRVRSNVGVPWDWDALRAAIEIGDASRT